MSNVSFVRTEMLSEKPAPASEVGAIGWLRHNLFSSWLNSILTVIGLLVVYVVLKSVLGWAIAPTVWGTSQNECREILNGLGRDGHFAGACWGVIRERWMQLMFGFYPSDLYWRPILAFIGLFLAFSPILSDKMPRKMLWFTAVFPLIVVWLLWGGAIWGPILVIAGVALVYMTYRFVSQKSGALPGIGCAIVVGAVWFLYAISPISMGINSTISNSKRASFVEQTQAAITKAEAEKSAILARQEVVTATIKDLTVPKDETAKQIKLALEEYSETGEPEAKEKLATLSDQLRDQIAALRPHRRENDELTRQVVLLSEKLSKWSGDVVTAKALPDLKESLPKLKAELEAAEKAIPDAYFVAYETESDILRQDALVDASKEEKALVDDALTARSAYYGTINTIQRTEEEVARIGLVPVESNKFGGFMVSILIGITGIVVSLPLGICLALGRQSDLLVLRSICVGFIEFIRGVPLITLLFVASTLLNIFLPPGTNFDIILRVMIMVTLFSSAYLAEVIRGGLAALPKGQYEAADSLGLNYWQAQRLIIMPQALKISIPSIVGTFIGLFKDTTLVSIIGLLDPIGLKTTINGDQAWNGINWEIYGFIAFVFFIFCFSMSRYSMYLENKLNTGHR